MRRLLVALLVASAALAPAVAGRAEEADVQSLRREVEATRRALERTLLELEAVRDELARTRTELDRLRAPRAAAAPVVEEAPPVRTHVVRSGETLGSIAARYYGSSGAWTRIRDANRATLPNPNRIEVGQVLVIP